MEASTIQANPAAAFDIAFFEAAETSILTLQNQIDDGPLIVDGKPVTLEMFGPGSEERLKVDTEIDRVNQDRMMKSVGKGGSKIDTYVDTRAVVVKRLIACTKSISPNFPIAPHDLYRNPRLGWITDQVARFFAAWENFPSPSAKS